MEVLARRPLAMVRHATTLARVRPKSATEPVASPPSPQPVRLTAPPGFPSWTPGAPRRFAWPLFGLDALPPRIAEHADLASRTFQNGARYLGDENDMLAPTAKPPLWTEVAVVGRSNAGKSTLLNALLGSKDNSFVPVSRHPGSTTHLDFYGLGRSASPRVVIVDSPGYGYSSKGKAARGAWMAKVSAYLTDRDPNVLRRTIMLIDARVGLTAIDTEVADMLEERLVPWHAVLTKADAVPDGQLESAASSLSAALAQRHLVFPVLNAVSARTGEGLAELQRSIIQSARLHRQQQ